MFKAFLIIVGGLMLTSGMGLMASVQPEVISVTSAEVAVSNVLALLLVYLAVRPDK